MSRFDGLLDRVIAPWPLLAGVVVGFVACSVGGRAVSEVNLIQDFSRFHNYIHPSSGYYPTASQIHSVGVELLDPQKIAVVVGGNSILHGSFQRPDEVWTQHLQAELGDQYCVVNLAVPAAHGSEFGGKVAERLAREHPRLIFLTCTGLAGQVAPPDGRTYRYLFWDAREKNLLHADHERDEFIRQECIRDENLSEVCLRDGCNKHPAVTTANSLPEMQRQYRLDGTLYFQDLWSAFTYQVATLVWHPQLFPPVLPRKTTFSPLVYSKPRRMYPVPTHPRILPGAGYVPEQAERGLQIVRSVADQRDNLVAELASPDESPLTKAWRANFPLTRRQTLLLIIPQSPYYVNRLTADEQTRYRHAQRLLGPLLAHSGFQTVDVGNEYVEADFFDALHLSEEGGRKLASDTAPKIREVARELGFTKTEEGR